MRRWLAVVALAASACGGADDGEVFGSETAGATSADAGASAEQFPDGSAVCDAARVARFAVPGRTASELRGHYQAYEEVPTPGDVPTKYYRDPSYVDGAVLANCKASGNTVLFRGSDN